MTEETETRKDLKIQALLEKISNIVATYENNIADLRVDFTLSEQKVVALAEELEQWRNQPADTENVKEEAYNITTK